MLYLVKNGITYVMCTVKRHYLYAVKNCITCVICREKWHYLCKDIKNSKQGTVGPADKEDFFFFYLPNIQPTDAGC